MKTLKIILIVPFTMMMVACINHRNSTFKLEGLWISNEETSGNFLSGTQKTVFRFDQNQVGEWGVRVLFLWNGEYSSEWEISNFTYNEINQTIGFADGDGDTPSDSIILVPADKDLEIRLFYPRIPNTNGEVVYSYKMPEQLDDGLQTASIYHEHINPDSMINLINRIINQEYGRWESLLILKDNKLIVEEYFYGYDHDQNHHIYSCTKSVTSLLLGIALDRHDSVAVDQPIFSFFPEFGSLETKEKEQITLEHVLSMTPGFEWHDYPKEMYEIDDRITTILNLPLKAKPGEKFHYNSGLSVLSGGIIEKLEGNDVKGFADQYLFRPLGITDYVWRTHKNGELELWIGLQMKPRDMAKIGLLVMNNGKWQDNQIVSQEWILESTQPRVHESEFFDYGYQWWLRTKNTRQWWKESESTDQHDMIVALGSGGNYIMVVKDLNLVVVTTASDYDNDHAHNKFQMVIEDIIPAISNAG